MNLFDKRNNLVWKDYLTIFWKRKWCAFLPFVVTVGIGVLIALNKQPVYESSSLIKIAETFDFSQALRKILPGSGARRNSQDVRQVAKEMVSTMYIDRLINQLNLKPDAKTVEQAQEIHEEYPDKDVQEIAHNLYIEKLRGKIQTRGVGRDMIEVRATAPDPEASYLITKNLVDIYIEETTQRQLLALGNASKFSQQQIAEYQTKLEQASKRLETFSQDASVRKVENKGLEKTDINEIENMLASIDIHIDDLQKTLHTIDSDLMRRGHNRRTARETRTMANIRSKIDAKIDQMSALIYKFAWKDPQLVKLNAEIDELRDQWEREVTKSYRVILNTPELKDIDLYVERSMAILDLDLWSRRKSTVRNVVEKYKQYVAEDPVKKQELAKLEDEVEQTKSIYNTLVEQARGTKLKEAMEKADLLNRFQILEPARKPLLPMSSGDRMVLLMTLFIAVVSSLGGVFVAEYLDKSVRTVEEAENEFNIPVIGIIPNLDKKFCKNNHMKVTVNNPS